MATKPKELCEAEDLTELEDGRVFEHLCRMPKGHAPRKHYCPMDGHRW